MSLNISFPPSILYVTKKMSGKFPLYQGRKNVNVQKKRQGSFLFFTLHQKVNCDELENQRPLIVFSDPRNLQSSRKHVIFLSRGSKDCPTT